MIKLNSLDKFYNKGKINEIHVINNTSITFPDTGLVALTGPSGCGKTTLLNVIGGLDKIDKGTFNFDGHVLEGYKHREWDIVRNQYIGYIFQNYNLVLDKTVYENVEMVLNMAGLYDKVEIEERINYVLHAVGMYNYRKRNVQALSGGQQQRVAIARAISKNPKVVLADEPTGNLDANNTFEVMSIIKKISQTCLVILVSHERELVDFYADRVIELKDGKISNDYENEGNRTLEHVDDRNIYLKDMSLESGDSPIKTNVYFEGELTDKPVVDLIYSGHNLYVQVKSSTKVKFITSDSEIKLIDDHYKKPETNDASEYTFDLTQFGKINETIRKSFFRFRDTFKAGFKKVFGSRKFFGKLFLLAYFAISGLVVVNLATFGSITNVDETSFLNTGKDLIAVEIAEEMTVEDVYTILDDTSVSQIMPYHGGATASVLFKDLYQGSIRSWGVTIQFYPMPLSMIPSSALVSGEFPVDKTEIVIDEWIADKLIEDKSISDLGVIDYETLLGGEFSVTGINYPLTIVGVIHTESPIVSMIDEAIYTFAEGTFTSYLTEGDAAGDYTLTSGHEIENDDEILVYDLGATLGQTVTINSKVYTIVGLFTSTDIYSIIISAKTMEEMIVSRLIDNGSATTIYMYAPDIDQAIEEIEALGFSALDSYQNARDEYVANLNAEIATRVQYILITLAGIVVYIYLMMRSSVLGRIKEIGIYRAIGASKRDIYKIFFSEIVAMTTVGSLSGYLFMTYIVNQVENALGAFTSIFYLPLYLFVLGIVIIYIINIVFGMIPIVSLLRKTPAEITAKFDI